MYLETKRCIIKYGAQRFSLPHLEVIVNDLNEIWSLDLAHINKLAKHNRDVIYSLIVVDCFLWYIRVVPLKTKYATESAKTIQNMIKHMQPKKVWIDDGTKFLGALKTLCNKRGIHLYRTFSEKKSGFAERNIRSPKKTFHRYLVEKWTYFYINNLDQFTKAINSRIDRVTKMAPNKAIENFVQIVKKEKLFEKDTSNRSLM